VAVSRCPSCGELYIAAVPVCADCGVVLEPVADADDDGGGGGGSAGGGAPSATAPRTGPDGTEIRDLHEWSGEDRRLLDGLLDRAGVARAWQGTSLVTAAAEGAEVDELVASVAAAGETVGYEVAEWPAAERERLVVALDAAGIGWWWDDDGDLAVGAADEARVDALFDELTGADGGPGGSGPDAPDDTGEEADGLAVQEVLSDLFVASDRLLHQPLDGPSVRLLREAAARATGLGLPYGFSAAVWRRIVELAADLSARFEPHEIDEDRIREEAAELRTLLRDVV